MRRLLLAIALTGLPLQAAAQTSASSAAEQLISSSAAEGVFEALPSDDALVVRHSRSGLVCRLRADAVNRLLIFPQAARGEDVACETRNGRESVALYATRYSFATTLDEQIAGVESAIRRRFPNAEPVASTMEIASDTLPAHRSVQFIVTPEGRRTYTRASVAQVGDWIIKLRYSVTAADDASVRGAELAANMAFAAALREMAPPRP